ncbi:LysR family transcriptional regulator [Pseudomonas sp. BP8]|uniref:LysR family transcriptional regulator n=1 Tax=Pseudomonas sp. BP8 TaxID=2817864 RepID=UPI001AE91F9E|nr:LysR family transcriptional regulator [Pseudomonas sp. BP8]MBP2261659.1 DNA-binding transcriptional LysR family regulator [Pseudomonas sp. BP8]HDS1737940.1 LysR family transcriptional regulator [Pseudomonas putida]
MESKGYLPKEHVEMLPCMAAFAVVFETGSFVDASARLGLTASAVSKQVSKLEDALSLRLLERTTRQLKVNAEGAEIYGHCKELLERSASVFRLTERFLEKPQGLIRIAVNRSLYGVCSQVIPGFLQQYAGVNVKLVACDGGFDFIADCIDIGVVVTDNPPLGVIASKLFKMNFEVCASINYLNKEGWPLHPSELSSHSCLSFSDLAKNYRWKFSSIQEECEVKVTGRYLSDSPEAVLEAAISGLGISCLPTHLVVSPFAEKQLVPLFPGWEYQGSLQGMTWVVYQPGRHISQRIKLMVAHLTKELRALET